METLPIEMEWFIKGIGFVLGAEILLFGLVFVCVVIVRLVKKGTQKDE